MSENLEVIRFEPPKNRLLMHTWESHNYWIGRHGTCPYCLHGSKPVHQSVLEEMIG